jgi:TetR/AcrR family transcriptional regulator
MTATTTSAPRRRGRPAGPAGNADTTRAHILESALQVFARHGFEGAVMRDIAAAAGVEHSLLRYHFTDKSNLWRAAVGRMITELDAEMDAARAGTEALPLVDRFRHWLRTYVAYCARRPEHARIMVQESMKASDRVDFIVETGVRRQHAALAPYLRQLMQEGHLPEVPVPSLIYIIAASAQSFFMLANEVKAAHGVNPASPDAITAHADAVVALLLR